MCSERARVCGVIQQHRVRVLRAGVRTEGITGRSYGSTGSRNVITLLAFVVGIGE